VSAKIIPIKRKPRVKDLTGQRFGRLTVVEKATITHAKNSRWLCHCDCGNETCVERPHLIGGCTRSCGCVRNEQRILNGQSHRGIPLKHGHCVTKASTTFSSYQAMKQRCTNPNNKGFHRYGGANPPVTIYQSWLGEDGFNNFLADMGERPPGTTLGRFLDTGNYEKSNVAWQTPAEQAAEQKKKRAARLANERKAA
jgi:hypothetical protein